MNSILFRTTLRILLNSNMNKIWHISQVFKEFNCLTCTYFYKYRIPIWSLFIFFILYWLLFQGFPNIFILIRTITVQPPRSLILFMKIAGASSIERVQIKKTKQLKRIDKLMEWIGKVGTSLTAYTITWRRKTEEHYRNELFMAFCRKRSPMYQE